MQIPRRVVRGGVNWEIGIDIYALLIALHHNTLLMLCITWITNENLLYSSGNSTQCPVAT